MGTFLPSTSVWVFQSDGFNSCLLSLVDEKQPMSTADRLIAGLDSSSRKMRWSHCACHTNYCSYTLPRNMISSIVELIAHCRVAQERNLSHSTDQDDVVRFLNLPPPNKVTNEQLDMLKPLYHQLLTDKNIISHLETSTEHAILISYILYSSENRNWFQHLFMVPWKTLLIGTGFLLDYGYWKQYTNPSA